MATLRQQLEASIDIEKWWKSLGAHDQCVFAARAAEEAGCRPSDIVYAVEKPWKWKSEAWLLHENRQDDFDVLDDVLNGDVQASKGDSECPPQQPRQCCRSTRPAPKAGPALHVIE